MPVAISEIVLLTGGAALAGYLIGRWITRGRIKKLREVLAVREHELSDCHQQHNAMQSLPETEAAPVTENLKLIEGIGPKIEELLHRHGIVNFRQLAETSPGLLATILQEAGPRFQIHNPATWPRQSALARDGKWEELEALQERLTGGRDA